MLTLILKIKNHAKLQDKDEIQNKSKDTKLILFPSSNTGPYLVLVEGKKHENIGGYQTSTFAMKRQEAGVDIEEIEHADRFTVKLYFPSSTKGNTFVTNYDLLKKLNITARIPILLTRRIGIIYGIPTNVSNYQKLILFFQLGG